MKEKIWKNTFFSGIKCKRRKNKLLSRKSVTSRYFEKKGRWIKKNREREDDI